MAAFNFQPGNFMLSQEVHRASHRSRPSNITLWFFFSWDLNGNFISDHVSRHRSNKGFLRSEVHWLHRRNLRSIHKTFICLLLTIRTVPNREKRHKGIYVYTTSTVSRT